MRCLVTALAVAAMGPALSACGSSDSVGTAEMEQGIKEDYSKQVSQQAKKAGIDGPLRVESVDCIKKGNRAARCVAVVAGSLEGRVPIDVTIDGQEYLWETDDGAFSALQPTTSETSADEPGGSTDTGGEIDPLKFLGAAGAAGDDIDNARLEGDVLVLELAGDPSKINTDDINEACPELRDEFDAASVEIETPDGESTPAC